MRYRGKDIELIGEKMVFGKRTAWIRLVEGKTIEAGLALKELKLRGEIKRTLLIVPKSAMLQWQSEMQQHFKERFHIYDSQLISSMASMFSQIEAEEELNFWRQHNDMPSVKEIEPFVMRTEKRFAVDYNVLCLTQQILFTLYGVRQQVASSIYSITRIMFCTMPLT